MVYQGSKNKIYKPILDIMQPYIIKSDYYIEPFVGGCNMIDKVNHKKRIGTDSNIYLIELLKYCQNGGDLPITITENQYNDVKNNFGNYDLWYVGLVGFCASFGGSFFNGYASGKNDTRDRTSEAIKNLLKQIPKIKDVKFGCYKFYEIPTTIKNCTIYLDPPYKNTKSYKTEFCYDKFYLWAEELSLNNYVFISEYSMPDNFKQVLELERLSPMSIGSYKSFTEKLFVCKGGLL